jgi:hypothetical protein
MDDYLRKDGLDVVRGLYSRAKEIDDRPEVLAALLIATAGIEIAERIAMVNDTLEWMGKSMDSQADALSDSFKRKRA